MHKSRIIELYKEDQKDRKRADFFDNLEYIALKDRSRRSELRALLRDKRELLPAEYFAAAMIFQHGEKQTHFKDAIRFARKAFALGHEEAGKLYAATIDRSLMHQGLPQKYGTQFYRKNLKSKWQLWKVDARVTDAERARLGVPPIHESIKDIETLNQM